MYQSNPRAPIPRSYRAHLKLFDSRLNSRKFDAKLRPPGRAFDYRRNVRQRSQDSLKLKDFVPFTTNQLRIKFLIPPLFLLQNLFACLLSKLKHLGVDLLSEESFLLMCYQ